MCTGRGNRHSRWQATLAKGRLDIQFVPCNTGRVQRVKLTQSARKRRIGKAHVLAAMENAGEPMRIPAEEGFDARLVWVGQDDRGVTLEVIAVEQPEYLLIIHVMPYAYRRRT